jgi:hypothetical protein
MDPEEGVRSRQKHRRRRSTSSPAVQAWACATFRGGTFQCSKYHLSALLGTRGPEGGRRFGALGAPAHDSCKNDPQAGKQPRSDRRARIRNTSSKLVRAVALNQVDDVEPLLAPALAQTAIDLADNWISRSDLSPTVPTHGLNVSLRTLCRVLAATEESVILYIR